MSSLLVLKGDLCLNINQQTVANSNMFLSNLTSFFALASDCSLCGCEVPIADQKFISKKSEYRSKSSHKICKECHERLPILGSCCYVCGLPSSNPKTPCGDCLKNSPPFESSISAFHYRSPVSEFITQFKYGGRLELLPLMTNYLIDSIQSKLLNEKYELPELLIPIPLFFKKRNKRGFNQSRMIANELSKAFAIPVSGNKITRIKETTTQASLDATQRKKNLRNAFLIEQKLPERIAIIDDIVTTTTTVSELSRLAGKNGAKHIEVWSLARAFAL